MFGPLTLLLREPLIPLVLVALFVFGLLLHNAAQAHLAARLGDSSALEAGFGRPELWRHVSLGAVVWYLTLGLGLSRPVPVNLPRRRALAVLLSGPLTLALWALVLMTIRQLLLALMPTLDVLYQGMQLASKALVLHAVFYLLPFPTLDGGRALWEVGSRGVRQVLAQLSVAGTLLLYILWVVLLLSGTVNAFFNPLWSLLQTVPGWLPF
ncbi:hypothetical protein [Deinococcus peraridilitoris]|uniref:Uncharacterized protein n=1 Tax=Deinococcus peraridilitoris (strain DSM 19664 / LMG 22246 / CIP 109416 / KR-200) TaxID=937777 RepID=K9ZYB6_DEIPD|nr:hypothetical protein [Deinococcus peraridilitoris]AFZ65932.1 hypothetical protein Deipe_0331 [Deinococcus peraridilitoris DSM 19664]